MEKFKIDPKKEKSPEYLEADKIQQKCKFDLENLFKDELSKCAPNFEASCRDLKVKQYVDSLFSCTDNFQRVVTRLAKIPVFCNESGDYIVRKDHLLNGAFGATTIEN